jgi:hypothetical protein
MHAFALTPEQYALASYRRPENEASLYHHQNRVGFFTVGYSTESGRKSALDAFRRKQAGEVCLPAEIGAGYRQRSFRLREMPDVLADLPRCLDLLDQPTTTDFWLSQAEFTRPNRQKINLARIAVCWVDLDLHHENAPDRLRSMSRDRALAAVLSRCRDRGIPTPSIVLWTGRGLAVKWYTDVLPKSAYPRWAAVQAAFVEAFADLAADAQARDASRVLRIAGT